MWEIIANPSVEWYAFLTGVFLVLTFVNIALKRAGAAAIDAAFLVWVAVCWYGK